MKIHDQEGRQYRKREIRDDTEGAVEVCKSDDDLNVNASPVLRFVPEVRDRMALKQRDEEENRAGDDRDEHGSVDDPGVNFSDGNAQEEAANRDLGGDHTAAVEEIAEPPAVCCFLDAIFGKINVVSAGAIVHANRGRRAVGDEGQLERVSAVAIKELSSLTVANTISQSSMPKAFTIRMRT